MVLLAGKQKSQKKIMVLSKLPDSGAGEGSMLTAEGEQEMCSSSMDSPSKNRSLRTPFRCFGVDLTPDNIAVAMVYFVQGVLGLSRLAVSFYLKDDLHLDPAEVWILHIVICRCVFPFRLW